MAVDLHTHSTYSDGTDPPATVVALAVQQGLSALALTDHDILDGIPEARHAAAVAGIDFIPGVELSVDWGSGGMHLLGYWIGPEPGPLTKRLEEIREGRAARNLEILAALGDLGIDITREEIRAVSGSGVVGRPHFAAVLVERGYAANGNDAFDRYLARGRPAYRPRLRLGAEDAIHLVHRSGGAAVVAHPHTLAEVADGVEAAFARFVDLGIDGVECYYSGYPPALCHRLADAAHRAGLVATGGSDFHGTNRPGVAVGTGRGDLDVPDAAAVDLRRAVAARRS